MTHRVVNAGLKTLYSPEVVVSHRILTARLTREWILSRWYWGGITVVALKQLSDDPLPRMRMALRVVGRTLSLVRRWRDAARLLGTRFGKDVDVPMTKQIELFYILGQLRQAVAEMLAFHGRKSGESGRRTEPDVIDPSRSPERIFPGKS